MIPQLSSDGSTTVRSLSAFGSNPGSGGVEAFMNELPPGVGVAGTTWSGDVMLACGVEAGVPC